MVNFEKTWFGGVRINGQDWHDVIVVGEEIEERDDRRLHQVFGRAHWIGDWEVEKLLSNNPEIVIIGNGTGGLLEVTPEVQEKFKKAGVELKILLTPEATSEFNKLYSEGKKINALIHTTC
ncbi:hypothetical protein HY946_01195 [Candidatus Gottesmanbacteria bacterium]|nr:hypothetical protein [Candidatus Gottesmanbacteria bacterium]